ncbi:MAG TPA: RDD family protein, partial [Thermoanaerobaculia bacterium]|nr:RDD family protein [Thermoanaerobaculia bacterium]
RLVGYFVSGLIFGLGFLMIAFEASKRGLHDMIAGTYVAHRIR